ncbi:hypothetical protein C8D97_10411 [Pleionea mediterranea]|uniref:Lipoprotein n=1 Tax=Pleionea mediterranea TaxID=523701 RepID=A0A316FWM1_9GAMM|nr:hypothetical protein C8D97_10411 [Pleionea mediterranea]
MSAARSGYTCPMKYKRLLGLIFVVACLAGCGQKGPLRPADEQKSTDLTFFSG